MCPADQYSKKCTNGFTLVEVLVALALMAVVVPVVLQGMHIATNAGEVAERKMLAMRIAERVMNEAIVSGQNQSAQNGSEKAGPYEFKWKVKDEPWKELGSLTSLNQPNGVNSAGVSQNNIHQFTVSVTYTSQGQERSVDLSTLVNTAQQ
jgi:type II secretion system protein I